MRKIQMNEGTYGKVGTGDITVVKEDADGARKKLIVTFVLHLALKAGSVYIAN